MSSDHASERPATREHPWESSTFKNAEHRVVHFVVSAIRNESPEFELRFSESDYGLAIDFARDRYVLAQVRNEDSVALTIHQAAHALLKLSSEELVSLLEGVSGRQRFHTEQLLVRALQTAAAEELAPSEINDLREDLQEVLRHLTVERVNLDVIVRRLRASREEDADEIGRQLS